MEKKGLCTLKSNTKDTDMNKINMNTGNKGEHNMIWHKSMLNYKVSNRSERRKHHICKSVILMICYQANILLQIQLKNIKIAWT